MKKNIFPLAVCASKVLKWIYHRYNFILHLPLLGKVFGSMNFTLKVFVNWKRILIFVPKWRFQGVAWLTNWQRGWISEVTKGQALSSVTRWLDNFFIIWPFKTIKVCYFDELFAKLGWQFCQILNEPSNNCQRVLKFCQNGEISPNFVTLVLSHSIHSSLWWLQQQISQKYLTVE